MRAGSNVSGMNLPTWTRWLALLGALLTGCATSAPSGRNDAETLDAVSSWVEARADPSCVVPICNEERCALWRCQDMVEASTPRVVLARSTPTALPPRVGSPSRWWGHPLAAPTYADPVFEIPWHNWKTRGQLNYRELRPLCIKPWEPFEKHHIFPQEPLLAAWFKLKHIDIHSFTIRLPKSFHGWLHSGGPKGGQWNEAWREFARENRGASPDKIWQFAFELMSRFGVNGPLVPYHCD
jgi:uncharacterized lipoprotein (TIGR02269 family)